MSARSTVAALLSLLLTGCVCGPGYDLTARYDQPLEQPVALRPGEFMSRPFQTGTTGTYFLKLDYRPNDEVLPRLAAECVLGHKPLVGGPCPELYQRTLFLWEVVRSGNVIAQGNSYPPPPEAQRLGIGVPLDQSFGRFFANDGETYTVRLIVENDARDFNTLQPKLVVARSVPGICEIDRWGK